MPGRKKAPHEAGPGSGNRTGNSPEPKFKSAEELETAINRYFDSCDAEDKLYSEAGLCLALYVSKITLQAWYDGKRSPAWQPLIQRAYLRIEEQIATDPRYQEKGMVTRGIFLNKQVRFGGYQDRIEARQDIAVNVKMGSGMDESDFA